MTTIANSQAQLGLANDQRATQNLHDNARKIDNLQKLLIPQEDKDKKLRKACEGFETIFVKKMWEEMQETIQESDFLKGKEEKHWRSMYNQELAETMSSAGGIGLADMMYRQLSSNLANATRASVATSFTDNSAGFEIKPVPLINLSDTDQAKIAYNSNNINDKIMASSNLGNVKSTQQDGVTNGMAQNDKSIYSGETAQPKAPNMEEIHNQSVKNVNVVIQNVLNQLKSQKNENNTAFKPTMNNAQLITSIQEQKITANTMYSANTGNAQQNHILQPNQNNQPIRENAYTQPMVNKVGTGVVLPNVSAESIKRRTLPKQSSIHEAQVHGNPGISPSKYVHNSPLIVKPVVTTNVDESNNAQIASNYNAAQVQNLNKVATNAQIDQMGQIQNDLTRQNINILPSQRRNNNI